MQTGEESERRGEERLKVEDVSAESKPFRKPQGRHIFVGKPESYHRCGSPDTKPVGFWVIADKTLWQTEVYDTFQSSQF